jgi:hypothetical protein
MKTKIASVVGALAFMFVTGVSAQELTTEHYQHRRVMKIPRLQESLAAALVCALTLFVQPLLAQSTGDELTLTPKYAAEEPAAPTDSDDSTALAKKLANPVALTALVRQDPEAWGLRPGEEDEDIICRE